MKKTRIFHIGLIAAIVIGLSSVGKTLLAETVTVDGEEYRSARMADVCREGIIYETKEHEFVTLPWAELTDVQKKSLKAQKKEALMNALFHAYYVKGTVFQANRDGVIVQIDAQEKDPEPYCRNGAEILTGGLVILKDLPSDIPRGEGDKIEIVAYKFKTYTFDLGIAAKEIPYLTVLKPLWGREQEWKNGDGQTMVARFVAIRKRVVFFEKEGKQFEYPLDKLDEASRKRAEEYQEKVEGFPFP